MDRRHFDGKKSYGNTNQPGTTTTVTAAHINSRVRAKPHSSSPRIGIFSARNLNSHVCRCAMYEFEDMIANLDSTRLFSPHFVPRAKSWWERRARILMESLSGLQYTGKFKTVERIKIDRPLELFLIFCQTENDILFLHGFPDWRKQCRLSACWIDELWAEHAREFPKQVDLLRPFDFVFLTFRETTRYLKEQGLNAHYIAPGVDAIRFCPYPHFPSRTIDLLAMGRKPPRTHRRLIELAESGRIHYVFDTSTLPNVESVDDHRRMMAHQIRRSKFFLVQRAKADEPAQTKGQIEVGTRFFEGCAGGAALVGESLDVPAQQEYFGWEDAIIALPYDSDDVDFLFEEIALDTPRMAQIQRRNITHSLLRNDWVYRWEQMLKVVGLDPLEEVAERKAQLAQLARLVEQHGFPTVPGWPLPASS